MRHVYLIPYLDFRENYLNSYSIPVNKTYKKITAYPLPDKYKIYRMSLFINNRHIGTYFAPFGETVVWDETVLNPSTVGTDLYVPAGSGDYSTAPNVIGRPISGRGYWGPGVSPYGIPKVHYYDIYGNLVYVAHIKPTI